SNQAQLAPVSHNSTVMSGTSSDTAKSLPIQFSQSIAETAQKYDIDEKLIHSVIKMESNYDPYAKSSAGAQGLMQLMPQTARGLGVSNSYDAEQNIEGGT